MASVNVFETLRQRVEQNQTLPEYERRAMYWFKTHREMLTSWQQTSQRTTFGDLRQQTFTKQLVAGSRALPGRLYFFRYSPLGRKTLPYYDRFPLVIPMDIRPGQGFMGLNLHYLNYQRRAVLFDALSSSYARMIDQPLNARLHFTYDMIRDVTKYKAFRPCVKSYDLSGLQTPLLHVGSQDWDLALFLPVEMFAKSTKQNVWLDSETKIV